MPVQRKPAIRKKPAVAKTPIAKKPAFGDSDAGIKTETEWVPVPREECVDFDPDGNVVESIPQCNGCFNETYNVKWCSECNYMLCYECLDGETSFGFLYYTFPFGLFIGYRVSYRILSLLCMMFTFALESYVLRPWGPRVLGSQGVFGASPSPPPSSRSSSS